MFETMLKTNYNLSKNLKENFTMFKCLKIKTLQNIYCYIYNKQ